MTVAPTVEVKLITLITGRVVVVMRVAGSVEVLEGSTPRKVEVRVWVIVVICVDAVVVFLPTTVLVLVVTKSTTPAQKTVVGCCLMVGVLELEVGRGCYSSRLL